MPIEMSNNYAMNDKKRALFAYKEAILKEIQYYDNRIEGARATGNKIVFQDVDSSDSDTELPLQIKPILQSFRELKAQEAMLKTCLQATQELTCLEVVQSEVTVLVEPPRFDGGLPVNEEGLWREVIVDCCVDLVPFAITFYTHKPERKFAPTTYHGLRAAVIKTAHESELAKSVLPGLRRPSDVVEVIKSYALAHRSRRSTLARLADKFAAKLFMEPMPEGGYMLKCANLLKVQWTIENKWSHIAPFHHRLKFDLEYMDESYIKIITQTHRQLSDPEIDTDERTLLLSKIISTCLEAEGPTKDLYDSLSSDPESKHLENRRTTLDREPEVPVIKKKKKDSEVMAPPKSLPKKIRPKSKENEIPVKKSESVKRPGEKISVSTAKKVKVSDKGDAETKEKDVVEIVRKNKTAIKAAAGNTEKPSVSNSKRTATKAITKSDAGKSNNLKAKPVNKTNENSTKNSKVRDKIVSDENIEENVPESTEVKTTKSVSAKATIENAQSKSKMVASSKLSTGRIGNTVKVAGANKNNSKQAVTVNNDPKSKIVATTSGKVVKKPLVNKVVTNHVNKIVLKSEAAKKVTKVVTGNKPRTPFAKSVGSKMNNENLRKTVFANNKVPAKAVVKDKITINSKPGPGKSAKVVTKNITNTAKQLNGNSTKNITKVPLKVVNKPKIGNINAPNIGNMKVSTSNTEKENKSGNSERDMSKLNSKSKLPIFAGIKKKLPVPLRVSPRKLVSKVQKPLQTTSTSKQEGRDGISGR